MKRSTNVIVSNLSTFYTGLFLLFGKKDWGDTVPRPASPLATAMQ